MCVGIHVYLPDDYFTIDMYCIYLKHFFQWLMNEIGTLLYISEK